MEALLAFAALLLFSMPAGALPPGPGAKLPAKQAVSSPALKLQTSKFQGADLGQQINAADRAAGPAAADITVDSTGTVTTPPTLGSHHRLLLTRPVTWQTTLRISNDSAVIGNGEAALQTVNTNDGWIIGTVSSFTLDHLWVKNEFPNAKANSAVLLCSSCDGITVTSNHVSGIGLLRTTSTARAHYAEINARNITRNVTLTDNYMDGLGNIVVLAYLEYVAHVTAANNIAVHAQYNVEWWGGNAAVEGLKLSNPRWAQDIKVTNSEARNVVAGFWGSMGEDIAVTGVTVDTCSDVGVDGESSTRVKFASFTVRNCTNGGVAAFFSSKDNDFGPGTVTSDTAASKLLFAHNVSANPVAATGVNIHNVTFSCNDPASMCDMLADPIGSFVFSNNDVRNGVMHFIGTNHSGFHITGNHFNYTIRPAKGFDAITIPGQVANFQKSSEITGNTFISKVQQPAGTHAIRATITDYNYPAILNVSNNSTTGFATDATFTAKSGNNGISPRFIFRGNTWGSNSVDYNTAGALGTFDRRNQR